MRSSSEEVKATASLLRKMRILAPLSSIRGALIPIKRKEAKGIRAASATSQTFLMTSGWIKNTCRWCRMSLTKRSACLTQTSPIIPPTLRSMWRRSTMSVKVAIQPTSWKRNYAYLRRRKTRTTRICDKRWIARKWKQWRLKHSCRSKILLIKSRLRGSRWK